MLISTGCICLCLAGSACPSSRHYMGVWIFQVYRIWSAAFLMLRSFQYRITNARHLEMQTGWARRITACPSIAFVFEPRSSYLAFLGRLTVEKGPEVAIRIARSVGMPLQIAGKVPCGERGYFKECLEPQIDGNQVQLTGEVNDEAKERFLAGAAALLFPIDWPAPFGLVMIEAMACGTPVIAFRSGSVPEVVDDGVTGFVVDGQLEAARAISRIGELDRREVRAHFERRFTARRMAQEYFRHYETVVGARSSCTPTIVINTPDSSPPASSSHVP